MLYDTFGSRRSGSRRFLLPLVQHLRPYQRVQFRSGQVLGDGWDWYLQACRFPLLRSLARATRSSSTYHLEESHSRAASRRRLQSPVRLSASEGFPEASSLGSNPEDPIPDGLPKSGENLGLTTRVPQMSLSNQRDGSLHRPGCIWYFRFLPVHWYMSLADFALRLGLKPRLLAIWCQSSG